MHARSPIISFLFIYHVGMWSVPCGPEDKFPYFYLVMDNKVLMYFTFVCSVQLQINGKTKWLPACLSSPRSLLLRSSSCCFSFTSWATCLAAWWSLARSSGTESDPDPAVPWLPLTCGSKPWLAERCLRLFSSSCSCCITSSCFQNKRCCLQDNSCLWEREKVRETERQRETERNKEIGTDWRTLVQNIQNLKKVSTI